MNRFLSRRTPRLNHLIKHHYPTYCTITTHTLRSISPLTKTHISLFPKTLTTNYPSIQFQQFKRFNHNETDKDEPDLGEHDDTNGTDKEETENEDENGTDKSQPDLGETEDTNDRNTRTKRTYYFLGHILAPPPKGTKVCGAAPVPPNLDGSNVSGSGK
ncbi:hypothetical protein POM88_044870 [Heracleum sosnowskyi]|uniref:Uncharacterized protein n=1 Tax=Heracleum sosnowskyi TaxID=360622 RepID=A0AAD8H4X1_9APIA|nr:hypothetical protein POM88_044870 [Heracleum sosnowskyi]